MISRETQREDINRALGSDRSGRPLQDGMLNDGTKELTTALACNPVESVHRALAYHRRTKHHLNHYATCGRRINVLTRIAKYCTLTRSAGRYKSTDQKPRLGRRAESGPGMTFRRQRRHFRRSDISRQGLQELRVDSDEIPRRMDQQRQAMARMVSWLDQWPSPPGGRPGRAR